MCFSPLTSASGCGRPKKKPSPFPTCQVWREERKINTAPSSPPANLNTRRKKHKLISLSGYGGGSNFLLRVICPSEGDRPTTDSPPIKNPCVLVGALLILCERRRGRGQERRRTCGADTTTNFVVRCLFRGCLVRSATHLPRSSSHVTLAGFRRSPRFDV